MSIKENVFVPNWCFDYFPFSSHRADHFKANGYIELSTRERGPKIVHRKMLLWSHPFKKSNPFEVCVPLVGHLNKKRCVGKSLPLFPSRLFHRPFMYAFFVDRNTRLSFGKKINRAGWKLPNSCLHWFAFLGKPVELQFERYLVWNWSWRPNLEHLTRVTS